MKKIKKIALISLIVFSAFYSAAWFIAAGIASNKVEEILETLKKEGKIKGYSANVNVSGFPFNFDVNFKYPKVDIDLPDQAGSLNLLYNGVVSFRVGFFSSYIKLITDGDLHLQGSVENRKIDILATGEKTWYQIELKSLLLSPTTINALVGAIKDPKLIVNAVKQVSLGAQKLKVLNKITNNNIFYAEKLNVAVSAQADENGIFGSYEDDIVNAEFYKDSISLYDDISRIPAVQQFTKKLNPKVSAYISVFTLPGLGKINHDIRLDFSQVKDEQKVNINKLYIKDNYQEINVSGSALNAEMKKEADLTAKVTLSSRCIDLLEVYLKKTGLANSLVFSENIDSSSFLYTILNPFDKIVRATSKDKRYDIKTLIKEWGPISIASKFKYSTGTDKSYDTIIDKIAISTRKFGIDVKGDLKHKNKKDTYDLKVKVNDYVYIIDTALDYINGTALNKSLFVILNFSFTKETRDDIKNLFKELSDTPNTNGINLTYTIVNKGNDPVPAIGNFSPSEVKTKIGIFGAKLVAKEIKAQIDDVKSKKKAIDDLKKGDPTEIVKSLGSLFSGK